jgi:vesicle-fusing ATPase
MIKSWVYLVCSDSAIPVGTIGLNVIQRNIVYVQFNEAINVSPWHPPGHMVLSALKVSLSTSKAPSSTPDVDTDKLSTLFRSSLLHHCFVRGQRVALQYDGAMFVCRVTDLELADVRMLTSATHPDGTGNGSAAPASGAEQRGVLVKATAIEFSNDATSPVMLNLTGNAMLSRGSVIFRPNWNFESMGIGGLDNEFAGIFRRAFASRVFPPPLIRKLGITHVRGILLYGPPGTGKTLLARQIGRMLNGKEPKVVNGPEVLNKYVGETEANIRKLFAAAEAEQKQKGDASDLHIIIMDELDAICRARGSRADSTGVHDTMVNQLLSKIDGVDSLNNILLIGMTNRKDLIDEALLRPGRLEVHMEISLPDETGRLQIFRIHTAKLNDNKRMSDDVNLTELAARTQNFSGAEIEGLVKSAASFALNRQIDPRAMGRPVDPDKVIVCAADFEAALGEVLPAFGVERKDLELAVRNGLISFGPRFDGMIASARRFMGQLQASSRTAILSVLLEGRAGSGKTAVAAWLALNGGFPYVKMISPESLLGLGEAGKIARITKIFEDAYKSPYSAIVVDDLERIIEYVAVGRFFSNQLLQTLLVLFKRQPPEGRKLLVLATTGALGALEGMELAEACSCMLSIPLVLKQSEVAQILESMELFGAGEAAAIHIKAIAARFSGEIPIKKLQLVAEMARHAEGEPVLRFIQAAREYGLWCFEGS